MQAPGDRMPTNAFYLTFDDGPYEYSQKEEGKAGGTEVVLKVLKDFKVKATFFICSKSNSISPARQYALVKRMVDEGHALANHGDDHLPMTRGGYNGIVNGKGSMNKEELANFKKDKDFKLDEKTGRVINVKAHVVKDFTDNQAHFEKLFKSHGKTLPGFIGSRLPGDGRYQKEIVKAVVEKTEAPHFGWHFEFAPNNQLNHVNKADWNGVAGVSATWIPKDGPKDQDILLLHDSHWKNREKEFRGLVKKLTALGSFKTLDQLPAKKSERFLNEVVLYQGKSQK